MEKRMSAEDVYSLQLLHGCCGTYSIDGYTGFSRFTPDSLAYYSERSDMDFIRSHAMAGISLECVTEVPEISFTYRLWKSFYLMNSGIDLWENDVFAAHWQVDPAETGDVTVTYRRKTRGPSRIRLVFPNGCVLLPLEFRLGDARPTAKRERTILFYGDSITQSAYIPNPSLSWYHPVADHLEAECINRGIGSMIFDEASLPDETDCRPDRIFIEYGANDLGKTPDNETALASAAAWMKKLCRLYPEAEKYVLLPDFFPEEGESEAILLRRDSYCDGLAAIGSSHVMHVLSGRPLIPALPSLYCSDLVHFNEAGSAVFANRLLYAVSCCDKFT